VREFAEGKSLTAAAVNRGRTAVCGLQTSVVSAGVRTQLSRSAGDW